MDQGLFNFDQFFVDQQSNNYIRGLTEVLDGDIAELPQRLQTFREKFKVETPPQEEQPFTFNLAARSYETIPAEAAANNANLRRVTYVQGDRFFVSRDFAEGDNQIWDEVASPSSVDVHQESSQLVFLDNEKRIVDWPMTLQNLNRMIASKPYSDSMMKNCLLGW